MLGTSKSIWGFTPQSVPGCTLWLDASDPSTMNSTTTVTQWNDKSGQSNNVTGTATLSGSNMTFNGTNQAFSNLTYVFPSSNYSMFAVYSSSNGPTPCNNHNVVYGSNGSPMLGTYGMSIWKQYVPPITTPCNYTGLASDSTGSNIFITTYSNYIYVGKYDGNTWTWTSNTAAGIKAWRCIASDASGSNICAGEYGYIYTGKYDGSTWTWTTQTGAGANCNWYFITSDSTGSNIAAAGSNAPIYGGRFNGSTWTWTKISVGSTVWTGLASDPSGSNIAATSNSGLNTYKFNGTTWAGLGQSGIGVASLYGGIAWDSTGLTLVVTGDGSGNIWTGKFNGSTWAWTAQTFNPLNGGFKKIVSDQTASYVVGFNGEYIYTLRSTNGIGWSIDAQQGVGSSNPWTHIAGNSNCKNVVILAANNDRKDIVLGSQSPYVSASSLSYGGLLSSPSGWVAPVSGGSSLGSGVATDPSGNVFMVRSYYSTGVTLSNATTIGGAGIILLSAGSNDGVLAKYSPSGALLWASRISSPTDDSVYGVATDSSGNAFVTGSSAYVAPYGSISFSNSAQFGGSVSGSSIGIFIAKYSPDGKVLWGAIGTMGATGYAYSVSTDPSGNVFMTGYYPGTLTLSNATTIGGAYSNVLSNAGGFDAFLAKYSSTGTVLWATRFSSISNDYGYGVATDLSGNVFVTGAVSGGTTLTLYNPGDVAGKTLSNAGAFAFIAKYSSSGTIVWAAQFTAVLGQSVATDSNGDVFVTGYYSAGCSFYSQGSATASVSLTLAGGTSDAFLAKYSSAGTVLWVAQIAGAGNDIGYGVTVDPSGNAIVSGNYTSLLTVSNATSVGGIGAIIPVASKTTLSNDIFVAKYSSTGTVIWALHNGSSAGGNTAYGVATDSNGSVFLSGFANGVNSNVVSFYSTTTFPRIETSFTVLGNTGAGFLAKYSSDGSINTYVPTASNAIVSATYTSSTLSPFANGYSGTAVTGTTTATTGIYVGGPSNYFNGSLSELLVYNSTLNSNQRVFIEGYLARKWGAQTALPITHPYYKFPPFNRTFTPLDIPACSVWLDAADGSTMNSTTTVTQWNDKSGAGNNVIGTATLSGRNMTFDGSTQAFSNTSYVFPNSAYSMFAVYSNTTAPATTAYMNAVYGGNGYPMLGVYDVNKYVSARSVVANTGALSTTPANSNTLVSATYTPSTFSPFINGSNYSTLAGTTLATTGLYVGGPSNYFNGSLSELLIYASTLTATQRQQLEGYLTQKWGLSSQIVSTQPYKYIPPITPTPIVAMSVGTVTLTDLTSTGGTLTWGSNATPVEGYMWYVGTGLGTGIVTGGFEQNPMIYTKAFSAPLVANTTYYAWVAPYSGGVGTYIYSTAVSACASLPGTDGYYNVFVSAYTTNGTSKWGAAIMGSNAMTLSTIAIDPSENIYVGGAYSNEVIAITNSSGVTSATLPANGSTNGFIAKYTSTGDLTWATNIAGGGPWVDALAIDASGNAYVAGPNPNGQATFVNVITDSYVIAAGYATSTTSALSTSSNGTTWVSQTPTGLAYSVLCTAWNGSIWVAGGQATSTTSALSTSTDGVTWVSQTPTGLGYAVQCVAWNGSTWVAGGKATSTTSALSTSSNGTTWVSQTITGITGSVNCVAWNGTTWVAGGQSGTTGAISTSTDGVTWVSKTVVGPTSNVKCVAWNGITWVAGGQATSTTAGLSTSSNGTTWVSRTPNGLAYSVNCVGWNGTLFVAGGQATSTTSGLSTSPDGTTWTSRTPTGLTYSVNCVTWNGSIWVAGGRVSATVSALSTSPDGITWTTRTITGLSYSVQSVASRGLDLNNWVGVLTSGNYLVKYTPAGKVTWVATSTPAYSVNSARQLALDSSGNIFIASSYISALTLNNVGGATGATLSLLGTGATNNGYVAKYTPSGSVVWVAQFAPSTGTTPAATCSRVTVDLSNNVYVTGNYGGGSVNLYNTGGTLGTTLVYYAASGSNVFVAKYTSAGNLVWATQIVNSNVVTSSSINTDSNGNVLVSGTYTTAAPTTGSAIAELYVIAGGYTSTNVGALSTSSNGTTWVSQTPTGLAYSVLCTAWNGSIWVAGGRATSTTSALSTSTDGVTWVSQTPTGLSYSVNCIAWNGSIWVAGGQATSTTSALSTSADGVTWTPRTITGITGIVNCVAWNGTTWVAVGQSGTAGALSTSPDAVTWTQRTIVGPTGNVKCVAFSGLSWAIGGTTSAGAGSIAVSTNLINWTTRSISTIMNVVNCILWNGAQWIAGGSATGPVGALATSANGGTTWVSQTITGITGSVNCIAWNGTTWVAGGQSGAAGALSTSPDGVTWTQQTITGITGSVQSIASRGNVYPNVRVSIPTSVTGVQSFLVKYTTNGVVLWMSQIPTASTAFASSTDSNGNVYNTGNYTTTSSVTLKNADATSSAYTLPISSGWGSLSSQYIVSYSSSGVVSNAFVFRPSQPADLSVGQGIAIKGSNLYTTGYYIAQVPTILRTSTYTYPEAVLYNQYTIPCLNSNSPVSWLSVYSPNGSNIWVAEQGPTTVGSAYADTTGGSIGVDSSSNVYILSIHLGTSMTPCNADGTASASFNVMGTTTNLIKYSPTGFVQWVAAASTQFIPLGVSISPPSGNINIAGAFNSNITLGGGYGISGPTLTTTTSGAFVAQYTSGGVVVWASKMILNATTSGVYVYGLATDMSGNIFITGAYGPTTATTFTMYNASGTAGPSVICSATLQYGFIAKYSSTGLAQWIINATGNSNKINGVSVDRNGMVYIAGNFNTSIVIGGTTFAPNPTSTNVYFVSALTSAGNITWMSYIVGDSVGTTITENLSADNYGNIYTVLPTGASDTITVYNPASTLGQTGVSAFTNTIASGGGTIFFKHSSAGTCMWAREGSYGSSARATTDPFGNVYINGSSWYSSLFAKYSPSGKYMFTQYGSSTGGTMRPIAVATGTSGVIYSYGTYTNNLSNALTFTKPI